MLGRMGGRWVTHTWLAGAENGVATLEQSGRSLSNETCKYHIYDPIGVLLGIGPREVKNLGSRRNLYGEVYICNNRKPETMQMSFSG